MIVDDDLDNLDDNDRDDLEEFIAECTRENPGFSAMVDAALQRRRAAQAHDEDPNKTADDESETTEILTSRFEA